MICVVILGVPGYVGANENKITTSFNGYYKTKQCCHFYMSWVNYFIYIAIKYNI